MSQCLKDSVQFSSAQSLSRVRLFATRLLLRKNNNNNNKKNRLGDLNSRILFLGALQAGKSKTKVAGGSESSKSPLPGLHLVVTLYGRRSQGGL